MTPLQLCEIFEEFPQTLFSTQAGAASSAAARPFVTAVRCSEEGKHPVCGCCEIKRNK